MGFGIFIAKIREKTGLTQGEFAEAVGLKKNQGMVSDWEREVSVPDVETFDRMLQLVDPNLTLEQCLVVPWEAPEAERKYRAILSVIGGISPAALVEPAKAKPVQVSPEANRGVGRKR